MKRLKARLQSISFKQRFPEMVQDIEPVCMKTKNYMYLINVRLESEKIVLIICFLVYQKIPIRKHLNTNTSLFISHEVKYCS